MTLWSSLLLLAAASSSAAPGCGSSEAGADVEADAAGEPEDASATDVAEAAADAGHVEADTEARPRAGPMTLVISEVEFDDARICDFDGDGLLDNAIADLGAPTAQLMLTGLNAAAFQTDLEVSGRTVLFFPWIDDLTVPEDDSVVIIAFAGVDPDDPPDRDDDFSGSEGFYVDPKNLDACGEPTIFTEAAAIEDGTLETAGDASPFLPIELPISLASVTFRGGVQPYGASAELHACGYAPIGVLGGTEVLIGGVPRTALELLLAGGASLGLPIPGISPDVDGDGDGLERVIIDDDGRVESCVDGDSTEIPGSDCWSDERIADGVSLTVRIAAVSAVWLGRLPEWERSVVGVCEAPPESSLFDAR